VFKISQFAKLGQVSVKTLRYYDQIGLLKPAYTDQETGYRYYRAEQLCVLNRILTFKELGFTLKQIQQLLHERISVEEMRGMFRLKQAEIQTQIEEAQDRLRRMKERWERIEREGGLESKHEVVLKPVPQQPIVSLRQATSIRHIPDLLDQLRQKVGKKQSSSLSKIVLWHGCEECEEAVDLEVGYLLPSDETEVNAPVRRLPEVPMMATLLHRCHPAKMCTASEKLGMWIESQGYRMKGQEPRCEIFLAQDEGDDDYLAEVQIAVEKIESNEH
jgi:DNA-binding transcriptional MerR regulator